MNNPAREIMVVNRDILFEKRYFEGFIKSLVEE